MPVELADDHFTFLSKLARIEIRKPCCVAHEPHRHAQSADGFSRPRLNFDEVVDLTVSIGSKQNWAPTMKAITTTLSVLYVFGLTFR